MRPALKAIHAAKQMLTVIWHRHTSYLPRLLPVGYDIGYNIFSTACDLNCLQVYWEAAQEMGQEAGGSGHYIMFRMGEEFPGALRGESFEGIEYYGKPKTYKSFRGVDNDEGGESK